MAYVAVLAYGDGDETETTIIESGEPSIAKPLNLEATVSGSDIVIEWDYTPAAGDVKEGFLLYIGTSSAPDWGTATDIENAGSDSGSPTEHFVYNSDLIEDQLLYIAIRAYGGSLTEDSDVFFISTEIERTNIKNISLLLKRFGDDTDYTCSVSVFKADEFGVPTGSPLGISTRNAEDITFESYYNFIFDPVIETEETNLVVTFQQSSNDSNNFILWMHSQELEEMNDWAIDTQVAYGDTYGYAYGYMYGQGQSESLDFFDVFGVDSNIELGYSLNDDYGFEKTLWKSNPYMKRCMKVYDRFNEISFDSEAGYLDIPGSSSKTVTFSNRQELFSGYKQNVNITDDRITLKDIGRRILFYDTNGDDAKWVGTNRNLAPEVLCYDINKQFNSGLDSAYNCFLLAGTTEGLFFSTNSGGDWSKIDSEYTNNKNCIAITFEHENSLAFYVAVEDSDSYIVYRFESVNDAPTLYETLAQRINHLYYSEYISALIIGSDEGIICNHVQYSSTLKVNKVTFIDSNIVAVCCDTEARYFNLDTFTDGGIDGTAALAPIYDLLYFSKNQRFYLATENGLYVAQDATDDIITTFQWVGQDPSESPYLINVNRTKTLELREASEDQLLYVAQNTGVVSTASGTIFTSLETDLYPDTDVVDINVNPVDERIVHILSNTTKGKYPFFTFLIDQSGDMNPGSQYAMMENIAQQINDSYSNAKFEVVTFSTKENDSKASQIGDRKGASNITEGFVSWTPSLISSLSTNRHYRTPFYEALWASLVGIYREGVYWYYSEEDQKKYKFEDVHNELFNSSSRIVILFTTGRDTNSTKTLEQILNGDDAFPGIKGMDIKLYIVAMGEQADIGTLSQLAIPDYELIHLRDENASDYSNFTNYIVNKEKYRYREGIYRKSFYSESSVWFTGIHTDIVIPDNTTIEARYRISDNLYNMGNFSDYTVLNVEGINQTNVNQSGRYIEIEYRLQSNLIGSSPSIKSISFNYNEPSKSHLILNAITRDDTDPMHQIHLTANMSVAYGGYGYYHFLEQYEQGIPVVCDADINNTQSFQERLFENIGIDKRSVINLRTKEITTTSDYMIYTAVNGSWDTELEVTVYNGETEISSNEYYSDPQNGTINFFNSRKSSDNILITIGTSSDYRLKFTFDNLYEETTIKMDNAAVQFLTDSSTILSRDALPLTASQIPDDTAAVVQYSSVVPGNSDIVVSGSVAYIQATYVARQELAIGNKILVGFGDFIQMPDESFIFKPHERNGITEQFQISDSNVIDYIKFESTRKGVSFTLDQETSLEGFVTATISGAPLRKNDIVYIYIGGKVSENAGYSTLLSRESETGHNTSNSVIGGLRTFVAIAAGANPVTSDLRRCLPAINYEGIRASGKHHVAAPVTPESNTLDVTVTIVDEVGITSENATANLVLTLINTSTGARTQLATATITAPDKGFKKIPVTITTEGTYQVAVKNLNTGYTATTNAILIGTDKRVYFGDFNAKSVMGNGRQSPAFLYEYARDKAGLDFLAIADAAWKMSDNDWSNHQTLADFYNVEGEFVAFMGAEWKPNSEGVGYRSAFFKNSNVPSISKLASSDLGTFYNNLSGYNSIIFTEHPSYNEVSLAEFNTNWNNLKTQINQSLELGIEMYSEHGNAESFSLSTTNGMISPAGVNSNSYVVDALKYGLKFSFLGNSNSNTSRPGLYAGELNRLNMPSVDIDSSSINNRGITGVISTNLSRAAIFEAVKAGRTFATTGARIYMEFRSGSALMGDNITTETPTFQVNVIPTTAFANVSLVRVLIDSNTANAMQTVQTISISSSSGEQELIDETTTSASRYAYFIRVFQEDGHCGWSSPIYVTVS